MNWPIIALTAIVAVTIIMMGMVAMNQADVPTEFGIIVISGVSAITGYIGGTKVEQSRQRSSPIANEELP